MGETDASEYWAKVQIQWKALTEDIIWINLRDDLAEVLDHEDEQRIDAEAVDADKVKKLLNILKSKPPDQSSHVILHECLRKTHVPLARLLDETDIAGVSLLTAEDNPTLDLAVRKVLATTYRQEEGKTSVRVSDVQKLLRSETRRVKLAFDWNVQKVANVVKEVFSEQVIAEGKGNKRHFRNLVAREQVPLSPASRMSDMTPVPEDEQGIPSHSMVRERTANEMKAYLTPIFTSIGIPADQLEVIQQEDIDGEVFLTLTSEDLSKLFPSISFGKLRKLQLEVDKLKDSSDSDMKPTREEHENLKGNATSRSRMQGEPKPHCAIFRTFDRGALPGENYVQGCLLPVESEVRGNLLCPLRCFELPEESSRASSAAPENLEVLIARQTVCFAAALLNERRNGTIYFGVSPTTTDTYQAGEVVGVRVDAKKCTDVLDDFIKRGFYSDQTGIAAAAIRTPQFIEVTQCETGTRPVYVVEIDVVPTSCLVKDEAFFVRNELVHKHKKKGKMALLHRLVQGQPKAQDAEELVRFMKTKTALTVERARLEKASSSETPNENLCQKIKNLFAGGNDTLDDDVYPLLFLSPLQDKMDTDYVRQNLSFIKYIDAQCVFDFDPKSDAKGVYKYMDEEEQVFQVLVTDNFDRHTLTTAQKKEEYDSFLASLKASTQRSWVFCNGYTCMGWTAMPVSKWKKSRSEGFREALRYYHEDIPTGRGLVVFFLFSENLEAILEVANEIIIKFQEQYMVVAETEAIAALWKKKMREQNWTKRDIEERCVVGMPWKHVDETFRQILQPQMRSAMEIPLSTGAKCRLREKTKNDMSDLEILSANECDSYDYSKDPRSREKKRQEVEAEFFRGGEAMWWNFWFGSDHVLERDKHKHFKSAVLKALTEEDPEDKVNVVYLQHQPGAGGTTSAKRVLWDLKDTYRCCVVRKFTDQTCEQIADLRQYEENGNPLPCLVLVDNYDDDLLRQLRRELEGKARCIARNSEDHIKVFCVLLICFRLANLPPQVDSRTIQLRHELSDRELRWFKKKNESLEKKFREDKQVDPRFLISFNILKENFSIEYIKRTVREILKEIKDSHERHLLTFLALLNTFDLEFHSVPVSCFDLVMATNDAPKGRTLLSFGIVIPALKRRTGWECRMSSSLRILLNQSSHRLYGSQVKSLRLINPLLSRELLLMVREGTQQTVSSIMRELLNSDIFSVTNNNTGLLMSVIKNVIIHRDLGKKGRQNDFSPIITDVRENEDVDAAASMLELVFEKTEDPFVAQQTARFFITTQNWGKAQEYAKMATEKMPRNSFLMDTLGQVYKQQVVQKLKQARETDRRFSNHEATEVVHLAKRAMDIFRQEQLMSKRFRNSTMNNCGYFGELRVIIVLLNLLPRFDCYSSEKDLHKYLVEADYLPNNYRFLGELEVLMKSLREDSLNALQTLEDGFTQLRDDRRDDFKRRENYMDRENVIKLKENLDVYFGEESNTVPKHTSPRDACEYRRRRAIRLGATSFGSLRTEHRKGNTVLIKEFMEVNMRTGFVTVYDIVTYMNSVILLNAFDPQAVQRVCVTDLMAHSVKLYEMRQKDDGNHLECFLYLVLFNFPTPPRRSLAMCQTSVIPEAIKLWKDAFDRKYPRLTEDDNWQKKRDTTFFFLGNGEGLNEIIYYEELDGFQGTKIMRGGEFWRTEKALTRLRRFHGVLQQGGMEIHFPVETSGGNQYHLAIATSIPIAKRSMWQKRVFFVLGMCWTGPKAFDVTEEDPTKNLDLASKNGASGAVHAKVSPASPQRTPTLDSLLEKLASINKGLQDLSTIPKLGEKDVKKKQRLERRKSELQEQLDDLIGTSN